MTKPSETIKLFNPADLDSERQWLMLALTHVPEQDLMEDMQGRILVTALDRRTSRRYLFGWITTALAAGEPRAARRAIHEVLFKGVRKRMRNNKEPKQ